MKGVVKNSMQEIGLQDVWRAVQHIKHLGCTAPSTTGVLNLFLFVCR